MLLPVCGAGGGRRGRRKRQAGVGFRTCGPPPKGPAAEGYRRRDCCRERGRKPDRIGRGARDARDAGALPLRGRYVAGLYAGRATGRHCAGMRGGRMRERFFSGVCVGVLRSLYARGGCGRGELGAANREIRKRPGKMGCGRGAECGGDRKGPFRRSVPGGGRAGGFVPGGGPPSGACGRGLRERVVRYGPQTERRMDGKRTLVADKQESRKTGTEPI